MHTGIEAVHFSVTGVRLCTLSGYRTAKASDIAQTSEQESIKLTYSSISQWFKDMPTGCTRC